MIRYEICRLEIWHNNGNNKLPFLPMNISLQLARPHNPDTAVIAQFKYDGKKRRLGLDVTVPSERWNKGKQRLKILGSMHVNEVKDCEVLNTLLEAREALIRGIIHELTMDLGKAPSWEEFKAGWTRKLKGRQRASVHHLTFNQWVDEFISNAPQRLNGKGQQIHPRTIQKYRTVQVQLDCFAMRCVGRLLTFDDWNRELLASYKRFRAEQGVSINTIAKDVKVLKLWLKEAYVRQLHDNRAHMEAYFNPSQVKTHKVHLTLSDLAILEAVELPKKARYGQPLTAMETVRDLFLLACWTGVRISDLKRFPELVKQAWKANGNSCPTTLSFVQAKTNSKVEVPLLDTPQRIINKYKGRLPLAMNEQKMNVTIKKVLTHAGLTRVMELPSTDPYKPKPKKQPLNELVTLHTARRTFATNMYSLQVLSVNELMSLTGHESESALKAYLNIDRFETSSKASQKIRKALEQRAA